MKTSLIVIDAQESFRHRPYFTAVSMPAYLDAQNTLIEGCVKHGIPIVRIFHTDGPPSANNAFALESGLIRPIEGLTPFEAAITLTKHRHSALVGSGLDVWLTETGVRRLIVSGIRTEQCCETTTRHASDLGWSVDYCVDATQTWDMQHLDGSVLSAADIKARTGAVLAERFARICSVQQALAT